jgi:hypothetical protein
MVQDLRVIFVNFSFNGFLKPPVMKKENLEKLTLHDLCDLLVENTILLLNSIEKKVDGVTLRDQKKNVELLQEVIREKRRMKRLRS